MPLLKASRTRSSRYFLAETALKLVFYLVCIVLLETHQSSHLTAVVVLPIDA